MTGPALDRWLLLGEKKDDVLTLAEVERYGSENCGDPDYLSLYGLRPADWYARGVRIAGRTAVECTRDLLADLIGRDIAGVAGRAPGGVPLVLDLFAGSANTLYWISRHVHAGRAVGFERDDTVFALTDANLSLVGAGIELIHESYDSGLPALALPGGELVVLFVAPPWGSRPMLVAVQVADQIQQDSLAEVTALLDWSALTMYDINAPGHKAGMLLGTTGWSPR